MASSSIPLLVVVQQQRASCPPTPSCDDGARARPDTVCVTLFFFSLSPFQAGKAGARSVAKNLLAEVVWIYEGSEAGVLSGGIGGAGL